MNENAILTAPRVGYAHRHVVRFQEIDAAGIVYFPTIISFFHDAYAAFLAERGAGLPALIEAGELAIPIRHAEADFLRPLRLGETIEVQLVGRSELGTKISIFYRVMVGSEARAVGQTVHVFVNRKTFARVEPSPELRAAFESLPHLQPTPA